MIKSMTGFSKAETSENGVNVSVEIKSLNGRYLEVVSRLPRNLQQNEIAIKDLVRKVLTRGTINVNVSVEYDVEAQNFNLNEKVAEECYKTLTNLKTKLKLREAVKMEHVLEFSSYFIEKDEDENEQLVSKLIKKAVSIALKKLDTMRGKEGKQIANDITNRVNNIQSNVDKIEVLGIERIPAEREKLRQRVAQLFESDEIDEQRLQTEMVLLADKLDISEECVRLQSHIKFFNENIKSREGSGRKLNFLLQEMHREVNTIGSKANDAGISQIVVDMKEELERIREQVQNIE